MAIDPTARFERQRQLAKQEQGAATQQAQDAMARRYAAMGRTNSGAAIKGERMLQQQSNEALQKRLQGIQDSQDTEELRRQEIDEGRKFQTSEREASQGFSRGEREAGQLFGADQAKLAREFATSERLGGQDFQSGEAAKQRGFISGEREAGQKFQTSERLSSQDYATLERKAGQLFAHEQAGLQRGFQAMLQNESLKQQAAQFDKQFELDQRVTQFNMDMADNESNDWFSQLGRWGTKVWKGWT